MKLIACIADNNGILFNNRRVSRDTVVIQDIIDNTPELCLSDYSAKLFDGYEIKSSNEPYLFLEEDLKDSDDITEVILYRWNRDYPADVFFNINLRKFTLTDTREFAGKSHEKVTREVWIRK